VPYSGPRRDDICLYLGPADRAELQALITNRNTARKLVWRAEIVLATADGHGTFEIMRRAPHVEAHGLALAAAISR
jgi:hypothetical protein